jgi:site-specific recombinase XerD
MQTNPLSNSTLNRFHKSDEGHVEYIETILYRARNGIPTTKTQVLLPAITEDDLSILREYLAEVQATHNITVKRVYKYSYILVHWREFIGEFRQNGIGDLHAGINKIQIARNAEGKPRYAKNTLSDYIGFLKRFYLWLIDNGYSSIEERKINKIRVPTAPLMTKTAEMLVSKQDVLNMIMACRNSRDRAFISVLYEGGFRVGELGSLRWNQVKFNDWNVAINVDNKTGKPRYIPLVMSRPYLAAWKNDYPLTITDDGYVFLTAGRRQQLQYRGVTKQFEKIVRRAGIEKRVTLHILRHSRITHLINDGVKESMIKMMMWGSVDSEMFKAYCHLTSNDVDDEIARHAGITLPDKREQSTCLEPRQCSICHTINGPTQHFCGNCGNELTEIARNELQSAKSQLNAVSATPEGIANAITYLQELQKGQAIGAIKNP